MNLDNGAITNATQLDDLDIFVQTNTYLANKDMVATATAMKEAYAGMAYMGPYERMNFVVFMARVAPIPDSPSSRVENLRETKKVGGNDKIIWGTGDRLRLRNISTDGRFLSGAAAQGVVFYPTPVIFPAASYGQR